MSDLKPWPDKEQVYKLVADEARGIHPALSVVSGSLAYQSLLADAALARLRVAVEALKLLQGHADRSGVMRADEALSAIGPIPELPTLPEEKT